MDCTPHFHSLHSLNSAHRCFCKAAGPCEGDAFPREEEGKGMLVFSKSIDSLTANSRDWVTF